MDIARYSTISIIYRKIIPIDIADRERERGRGREKFMDPILTT